MGAAPRCRIGREVIHHSPQRTDAVAPHVPPALHGIDHKGTEEKEEPCGHQAVERVDRLLRVGLEGGAHDDEDGGHGEVDHELAEDVPATQRRSVERLREERAPRTRGRQHARRVVHEDLGRLVALEAVVARLESDARRLVLVRLHLIGESRWEEGIGDAARLSHSAAGLWPIGAGLVHEFIRRLHVLVFEGP
eukprot:scaffold72389_cov62-Phaeocystis_antarctica.AAC.2